MSGSSFLFTAVLLYEPDRELGGANDLDVVVECSKENAVKVFAAAQACGAKPIDGETEEDCIDRLSRPNKILTLSHGGRIEVMTSTKSKVLSFEDLWRKPSLAPVSVWVDGETRDFKAPFVTKAHLIQLKQEAIKDPARKEKWEQDNMDLKDLLRSP